MPHANIKVFSGNANPRLAMDIAEHLNMPLGKAIVSAFSDGETFVEIQENVRGCHVFIVQSTSAPANDNLMELLAMGDALRRASAASITAVIPYFGYARQDRRVRSARVPITSKIVADMIAAVGINRVLTVDLHADQIQGFFYIPVDNVYSTPLMLTDINRRHTSNVMVISPDIGGVVRARAIAKRVDHGAELSIIDKRRPSPNEVEIMHIIGDVKGYDCIVVDDIIDTAGTLCMAVKALKEHGAKTVSAYCTHPVLSGKALDNINGSDIDELIVSDTIALSDAAKQCKKIRQLSIAATLAEAIHRVNTAESLSSMFIE